MMFCLRPRQHFHWCFILPANEVETWRTRTWRCVPKTTRTTNVAERSSHAFFCCEANYQQLKCNPRLFFASLIIVFFAALLSPSSKKGVSAYSVATWQAQLAYSVLSQAVSTDLWASLSNCFRLCISLLPDEISTRQFEKNESKLVWQHLLCSLFVSTCAKSVISCENKIFAKKTSSIGKLIWKAHALLYCLLMHKMNTDRNICLRIREVERNPSDRACQSTTVFMEDVKARYKKVYGISP